MATSLSLREQKAKAEATLRALLRKPKSRSGLVAAVVGGAVTKNFVYGFLSVGITSGEIVVLKSTSASDPLYQLSGRFHVEVPAGSGYPLWLDPRALPAVSGRRVYIGATSAELLEENNNDNDNDF